jgi:hypothetical protein
MWQSNLQMSILCSSVRHLGTQCAQIFCTIPGLHRQYCAQFQPTAPMQWINIKLWPVNCQESFPPLLLHSHLSMKCLADRCHGCLFDNYQTLCVNFWHAALSPCYHHITIQTANEFQWGKYLLPIQTWMFYRILHGTKLSMHKNLSLDWTHASHLLNVIPNIQALQPIEKRYTSVTQTLQDRELFDIHGTVHC